MFIINGTNTNSNPLIFVKSPYINVFPCGRRRSTPVDADNNNNTVSDRYYIPFDPEARLNTEANNRKHTGLNGFRKSYIIDFSDKETSKTFNFVIEGYHISIKLGDGYLTPNDFGSKLANKTNATNEIFANITLRDVPFFAGSDSVQKAYTEILRDQTINNEFDEPETCLDRLILSNDLTKYDKANPENYYFSGLSFSSFARDEVHTFIDNDITVLQRTISLKILTKNVDTGEWGLYNPSRLPNIEHGDEESSVKIPGDLTVTGTLNVNNILKNGSKVALLDVVKQQDGTYQLQFTGAN